VDFWLAVAKQALIPERASLEDYYPAIVKLVSIQAS
jgi:hypothetical protein